MARGGSKVESLSDRFGDFAEWLTPRELAFLPIAAEHNDVALVSRLLRYGFDPKVTGRFEATALHWAGYYGNRVLVEAIREACSEQQWSALLAARETQYDLTPRGWAEYGQSQRADGGETQDDRSDFEGVLAILTDR